MAILSDARDSSTPHKQRLFDDSTTGLSHNCPPCVFSRHLQVCSLGKGKSSSITVDIDRHFDMLVSALSQLPESKDEVVSGLGQQPVELPSQSHIRIRSHPDLSLACYHYFTPPPPPPNISPCSQHQVALPCTPTEKGKKEGEKSSTQQSSAGFHPSLLSPQFNDHQFIEPSRPFHHAQHQTPVDFCPCSSPLPLPLPWR